MRTTDALTKWALRVALPTSRQVGADRAGRVLVALVQYANSDGIAWPSHQTLANDLGGLAVWDVRNALDALARAGLIEQAEPPRPGRTTRWRFPLAVRDLAGIPAGLPVDNSRDLAGNLAGNLAGDLAGMPATNRTEPKVPPNPPEGGSKPRARRRPLTDAERRAEADRERAARDRREADVRVARTLGFVDATHPADAPLPPQAVQALAAYRERAALAAGGVR